MRIQRLYKYGGLNNFSEDLFTQPNLWFSAPSQLNDPFECQPNFIFKGNEIDMMKALMRMARKKYPGYTEDKIVKIVNDIYSQGRFRDPEFWWGFRDIIIGGIEEKIGLYCMSARPDSILMWSHYGRSHTGYCLQFEATDYTPFFGTAQQVNYADDYPIVNAVDTALEDEAERVFFTKHSEWAYEKEWRIVDHIDGSGLHEYPADLLRGVIFGLRMSDNDKAQIMDWIRRRGHEVSFYQAEQNKRKFAIEIREIK